MGYIDVFIPLAFGIVAISIPQLLIKEDDPTVERKVVIMRKVGYGLIAVAIIYGIIKYFTR
jgi:uncharacterized membrane protein